MKKLCYATFEKGLSEIIEKVIKKIDKNAFAKKVYQDAVLFFCDSPEKFIGTCFLNIYQVFDYSKNEGFGMINAEIKHLLEKDDLLVAFPKDVRKFRITYLKENDKVDINPNLRKAFEIKLSKLSHCSVGFFDTQAELCLIARDGGDVVFCKNLNFCAERKKSSFEFLSKESAFVLNFLSDASAGEVSLDPFAYDGLISYVRAKHFKKANIISASSDEQTCKNLRHLSKTLKENNFSVLNYDFLDEKFPIKFIDKIVTILPGSKQKQIDFINKAFELNVKTVCVCCDKSTNVAGLALKKYKVDLQLHLKNLSMYKLEIIKTSN